MVVGRSYPWHWQGGDKEVVNRLGRMREGEGRGKGKEREVGMSMHMDIRNFIRI